jgi:hypothetical protein
MLHQVSSLARSSQSAVSNFRMSIGSGAEEIKESHLFTKCLEMWTWLAWTRIPSLLLWNKRKHTASMFFINSRFYHVLQSMSGFRCLL